MESTGLSKILTVAGTALSKNSPTILTGIAVGGLITSIIFAIRATPNALLLLEDERGLRIRNGKNDIERYTAFTKKEVVQLTWKEYIPVVCMGAISIACIIGSNSINQRRNAALATMYGITEAAFREYKDKIVETIGKNKELKVRDEINGDHIKNLHITDSDIILTGKGNDLCYDSLSGQLFKSDIERIRQAINSINEEFLNSMWVNLNDVYAELGIRTTKLGDLLGWDLEQGIIKIGYGSQLTERGEPCLVLNYDVIPRFYK